MEQIVAVKTHIINYIKNLRYLHYQFEKSTDKIVFRTTRVTDTLLHKAVKCVFDT